MIYFYTRAYNAAKTLKRTINSVLNQTKYADNIRYYICDNGSTDSGETRKIIEDYSRLDSRIVPFANDTNLREYVSVERFEKFVSEIKNDDFFCHIDADDEYSLDFLEKTIAFIMENDLEIASCCSNHIDAVTDESRNRVVLQNNIIVLEKEFGEKFPDYFRYMGALWGKLFSGSVFKRLDREKCSCHIKNLRYSSDTILMFELLKSASRIGVLAEMLHKYYLYQNSVSSERLVDRFEMNRIMVKEYRDFLAAKTGSVSSENENYICGIYLRAIGNTVETAFNDKNRETADKLDLVYNALNHDLTLKIWGIAPVIDKKRLRELILDWIDLQDTSAISNHVESLKKILRVKEVDYNE